MSLNGREIITNAEMRAIDAAAAAAGVPVRRLMANAGAAVANAIAERWSKQPVVVLCGPGANGGDGWVAATELSALGWPVTVLSLVDRAALKGEAAEAAAAWRGEVLPPHASPPDQRLVVDAMFGAGLSRPLEGDAARLAEICARDPERVIAVDVPSGLDGDTGNAMGETSARAALTVSFVRKKPAHLLYPGRAVCGDVIIADIGAPDAALEACKVHLWENDPVLWSAHFPWPSPTAHKHARGHAVVASGGHMRTGAARLAAEAALRIGAGLVTVLSPPDARAENAAHLTAIMLHEAETPEKYAEAATHAGALIIGPAFGLEASHWTRLDAAMTASNRAPIVFDADALTLLAAHDVKFDPRDVLTPHVGEFKRLRPGLLESSPSRIEAVCVAAVQLGAVTLLKGPDTVIAAPDGRAIVNATGTPLLATAGSGDVLAGLIGGLIAQGMPSFEAAAAGVWIHGRCGEHLGPGLTAEDLPRTLPDVLNALAPRVLRRKPIL